jgi:NAD(P)-dependent dehydrogenase (short-subunit alcohol dehydrogenase family)
MKASAKKAETSANNSGAVKARRLEGKIALVTGAAGGLGQGVASRLALEGAAVAVHYRSQAQQAALLVREIRNAGGVASAYRADLTKPRQVRAMLSKIKSELGAPDILVNNAAVFFPGDLATFNPQQFAAMRAINVDGVIHVTKAVVGGMIKWGCGRIVNLTSVAGTGTAFQGTTFYAATKAALAILTRRFAMDLGPHGITVNAVAPGYILVGMNTRGKKQKEIDAACKMVIPRTMMRRVGWAEDIAAAVAYLVSPEAGYVTAQVLTVDGGRLDYISHT